MIPLARLFALISLALSPGRGDNGEMAEIKIELVEEDIEYLIEDGTLLIPLGHGIIDADPAIKLKYEGDTDVECGTGEDAGSEE